MPSNLKRYQPEGSYHFITFSCYQRRRLLNTDHARTVFEETLERFREKHQFLVFGYVLMPEHVHLLLSTPKKYSLAISMGVLKGETSKLLRKDLPQFWHVRYHGFNVFTTKKYIEKLKYIHRNPVVRGLVEKPEDWPWSSYRFYSTGQVGRVQIESDWVNRGKEDLSTPPMTKKPS